MTSTIIYEAFFYISVKDAKILSFNFDWPENDPSPPTLAFFEGESPNIWIFLIQSAGKPNLENIKNGLVSAGKIINQVFHEPQFTPLKNKNWVKESQKLNAPVAVGRYVTYGSHDNNNIDHSKTTLLIEAGQAFGTGSHPTTRGCLLALDELGKAITPKNALDLGCGSGVLAIAISKTWNIPVVATDIDPIATKTTQDNTISNNVKIRNMAKTSHGIFSVTANNFEHQVFQIEGPFDLIIANILAKPLCEMANDIFANTSTGGTLVLSGLLLSQKDKMKKTFEESGFEYQKPFPIEDWVSMIFKK
ncbi:MAG: 50S ribosomal protein L11 methyltransferase [Sphingomonadales bacterium]